MTSGLWNASRGSILLMGQMLKSDLWVPTPKAYAARVTGCIREHTSDLSLLQSRQGPLPESLKLAVLTH